MKTILRQKAHQNVANFQRTLSPRRLMLILSVLFITSFSVKAQSNWKPVKNQSPYGSGGVMLLLSDGTVMAKTSFGSSYGNTWTRLKPDSLGSYANGTWSTLPAMRDDRLYFSSQVLKDGRVYVAGGEYGTGGGFGEVYNPLSNAWTQLPDPVRRISDANSYILEDGRVLQACVDQSLTGSIIYDPAANTYTAGPTALGVHNESAWLKLPDNSILYVDRDTRNSERYIPSLNKWVADAQVPVDLYDIYGSETGAAWLLPDGRAFFIGSLGYTAYYTPSGTTNPGVWTAGPKLPNNLGVPDAPGAMMVNGKILLAVSPAPSSGNVFPAPTSFYEFDYRTNSYTQVTAPDGSLTGNYSVYVANMLTLPDGTVLYSTQGNSQYYIYTPVGAPLVAGKPVISQVTANNCSGSSYTISGTGFNGISEGASYGDDWQMSTNYPIVRLTNGARVYYARTYNWNSTGVKRGSAADNAQFTLPAGLPMATYSLVVTANGISSDPVSFTPPTNCITVAITSPANNATFTAPANITFTASATTNSGTISSVSYYNGATLIGTSTVAPYSVTWSNVAAGTYTVVAQAKTSQGALQSSAPITINVRATSVNLALNKPAQASSSENSSLGASNAVDGNAGTRWSSAFSDPQWIYSDLGATYSISRVKLTWEGAYGKDFKIQTSSDAVSWTDIKTVTGNTALINDFTSLTGSGRYVRIYGTARGTVYGYSLYEFEVYGTSNTNIAPVTSITSPANSASFPAPAAINITANASDADGTVSKVEFYKGSILLGTDTIAPYSFNWVNVPAGSYSLTSKAYDNKGASAVSATVNITVTTPSNLALNRPAFSSSNESSSLLPGAAVDGNFGSRWASGFSDAQWIYVDLGSTYHINRVKITWEAAYGKDYALQSSPDAVTWTDFFNATGNTSLVNDLAGVAATGRYIRLLGKARGTVYGYSIYELEMYGTPGRASNAKIGSLENTTSDNNSGQFNAYPNPANNELFISVDVPIQKTLHISITDIAMKEVVAMDYNANSGSNLIQIPLSELPAGFYVVKVSGQDQTTFTRKIIKQ